MHGRYSSFDHMQCSRYLDYNTKTDSNTNIDNSNNTTSNDLDEELNQSTETLNINSAGGKSLQQINQQTDNQDMSENEVSVIVSELILYSTRLFFSFLIITKTFIF